MRLDAPPSRPYAGIELGGFGLEVAGKGLHVGFELLGALGWQFFGVEVVAVEQGCRGGGRAGKLLRKGLGRRGWQTGFRCGAQSLAGRQ